MTTLRPAQECTWHAFKARASALLSAADAVVGSGPAALARLTGQSQAVVRRWLDPDSGRSVPMSLLLMPGELGDELLRQVARARGYEVVRPSDGAQVFDDMQHMADLMQRAGAAAGAGLEALRDGVITPDEAVPVIAQLDTVEQTARSAKERYQMALRNRGDGVRVSSVPGLASAGPGLSEEERGVVA